MNSAPDPQCAASLARPYDPLGGPPHGRPDPRGVPPARPPPRRLGRGLPRRPRRPAGDGEPRVPARSAPLCPPSCPRTRPPTSVTRWSASSTTSSSRPPCTGSTPASSATSPPTPRWPRCSATSPRAASARRACSGRPRRPAPSSSRSCSTAWPRALGLGDDFTFAGGGGGSLQDSASSGALVALLAALHRRTPDWRATGVSGRERVYLSADTHSSVAKAVRVAGLGERSMRPVPFTPGTQTIDPDALAAAMRRGRRRRAGAGDGLPHGRYDQHGRGRPGPADRRGRRRPRRLGPRRRRLGRRRRAVPRAPRPARRRRARRLVLHRRPQVADDRVRRLVPVGARRRRAAGGAVDHPGVPPQRRHRLRPGRRLPRLAGAAGPPDARAQAVVGHHRGTGCPGCARRSASTSRSPTGWPTRSAPSPASGSPPTPSLALVCLQVRRRRRRPRRRGDATPDGGGQRRGAQLPDPHRARRSLRHPGRDRVGGHRAVATSSALWADLRRLRPDG